MAAKRQKLQKKIIILTSQLFEQIRIDLSLYRMASYGHVRKEENDPGADLGEVRWVRAILPLRDRHALQKYSWETK